MTLLVVSFPCTIPVNQGLFSAIEGRTDWDITIITPSNWTDGFGESKSVEKMEGFNGEIESIPVIFSGNIPLHTYLSSFYREIKRIDPDAIYVHHEAYAIATFQVYLSNWLFFQKPIGFYSAQNIPKEYPPPFCYFESFVYSQSDFSFPITEKVLDVLRHKGYEGPATVLPLGIDEAVYHPREKTALGESGESTDEILIGYVGRIVEMKGLETLIRALKRLEGLPWKLILIGRGPYESELERISNSLSISDRVTHIGYVPHSEVPTYLSSLDILVLPSETQPDAEEQFGRVIIEGLACETPVVGSDSGEIPNLIQKTGGGLVFPEGNPRALASRLQSLIGDSARRRKLAQKGRQMVLDNYTHSSLSDKFASSIDNIREQNNLWDYQK